MVKKSGAFYTGFLALALVAFMFQLSVAQQETNPSGEANVSKININTADAEQLQTLPGVGPVIAQRIIEYREKHGPFRSVDQLIEVKGIGQKRLEAMRELISVE